MKRTMKRTLITAVLIAMVLGTSAVGWTEEPRPAADTPGAVAAPAADSKEPKAGGCMPDGGCCGAAACKQAMSAAAASGKNDAPAAGGGCPCGRAKKAE